MTDVLESRLDTISALDARARGAVREWIAS